jgi:hypothetical protein
MSKEQYDHLEPIPKDFYAFETNTPFTLCIECHADLMNGQPYLIEKAFKNHLEYQVRDTVFDYALCMKCAEKLRDEMSKESLAAVTKFFAEHLDFQKQLSRLGQSAEETINACMISGKPVNECSEFQIYAYCIYDRISSEMPPYMICGEVMDQIIPLLSEKTTEGLNGFFNRHFSPDPSLMEPMGPKFVFV